MINRRGFVKLGTVGVLSLIGNQSVSFADKPKLEKTVNTAIDKVTWENFSRDLKKAENQLTQIVISGKVTLKEINNLSVVQYELFSSRLWQFNIGKNFVFFARPLEEIYIVYGGVVGHDQIAEAVELTFKRDLKRQYEAIA